MPIRTICECDSCRAQVEGLWPMALMNGWHSHPTEDAIFCPECFGEREKGARERTE